MPRSHGPQDDRVALNAMHGLPKQVAQMAPKKKTHLRGEAIRVPVVGSVAALTPYHPGRDTLNSTSGASSFYGRNPGVRASNDRSTGYKALATSSSSTSQYRNAGGAPRRPNTKQTAHPNNLRITARKTSDDNWQSDADDSRDPIDFLPETSSLTSARMKPRQSGGDSKLQKDARPKNPYASTATMAKTQAATFEEPVIAIYVGGHLLESKSKLTVRLGPKEAIKIVSCPNTIVAICHPSQVDALQLIGDDTRACMKFQVKPGTKGSESFEAVVPEYDSSSTEEISREIFILFAASMSNSNSGLTVHKLNHLTRGWSKSIALDQKSNVITALQENHESLKNPSILVGQRQRTTQQPSDGERPASRIVGKKDSKRGATSATAYTLDDDDEEVEPRRSSRPRTSATPAFSSRRVAIRRSQHAATAEQPKLFSFPFSGPGAVSVYPSDLQKLDDEEFLNDTIVEFALKLQLHKIAERDKEVADSIYIFSSFFYKTLSEGRNPSGRGYNHDAGFKLVQNWTSKVDLFKKKYLVIPINEHLHWYLAIIINPQYLVEPPVAPQIDVDDDDDGDVHLLEAEQMLAAADPPTAAPAIPPAQDQMEGILTNGQDEIASIVSDERAIDLRDKAITMEQEVEDLESDLQDAMDVDQAMKVDRTGTSPDSSAAEASSPGGETPAVAAAASASKGDNLVDSMWHRPESSAPSTAASPRFAHSSPIVGVTGKAPKRARPESFSEPSPKKSPYFAASTGHSPLSRHASNSQTLAEEGGNAGRGEMVGGGSTKSQSPADEFQEYPRKSGRLSGSAPASASTEIPSPRKANSKKRKGRIDLTVEAQTKTMIVVMDSLQQSHRDVHNRLSEYLRNEYKHKKKVEDFDFPGTTRGVDAVVPRQPNFCDCGLYLVHFFMRFFTAPQSFEELVYATQNANDPLWQGGDVASMRSEWRQIIAVLAEKWSVKQQEEKALKDAAKAAAAATAVDAGGETSATAGKEVDPGDDSDELEPLDFSRGKKQAPKKKSRRSGSTATEVIEILDSDSD